MLARQAVEQLEGKSISVEVIDVRVLNPFHAEEIVKSVKKTKNLLVIDSGWTSGDFSAEIIAKVVEQLPVNCLNHPPARIALPDAPAPTSRFLERDYYISPNEIVEKVINLIK